MLTVPEEKIAVACKRIAEFCHEHYNSRVEEPTIANVDISSIHINGNDLIYVKSGITVNGSNE